VQDVAVVHNPVSFSFSQGCTALSITGGKGAGECYSLQGGCRAVQALGSLVATATASWGSGDGEKTQRQASSTGKLSSHQTWYSLGMQQGLTPWAGWGGRPDCPVAGWRKADFLPEESGRDRALGGGGGCRHVEGLCLEPGVNESRSAHGGACVCTYVCVCACV